MRLQVKTSGLLNPTGIQANIFPTHLLGAAFSPSLSPSALFHQSLGHTGVPSHGSGAKICILPYLHVKHPNSKIQNLEVPLTPPSSPQNPAEIQDPMPWAGIPCGISVSQCCDEIWEGFSKRGPGGFPLFLPRITQSSSWAILGGTTEVPALKQR